MKTDDTGNIEDFLRDISAETPHSMPVMNMESEKIGTITFFQGQLTHVNAIPVSELCEQLGAPSLSVPAAVNYLTALHLRQCSTLH